jgi:hypothetical protein
MAYDKKNNKLYIAANNGLKVSSDNGNSFTDVIVNKTFDVKVGSDGTVICSVQLSGDSYHPILGDVRVSTDNGNTFHSVCGTSNTKIPDDAERIAVAIAPSDPNIMYALLETSGSVIGAFYGVYVSIDKGETWNKIFNEGGYNDPMNGSSSGVYASAIAVPPTDPTRVLVGSSRLYEGIKQNSEEIIYGWLPRDSSVRGTSSTLHTIVYEGSTIYLGTSAGIYYSTDGGRIFYSGSRYLSNLQVYSMSVGNDGRIIAGTRENGSIYMERPIDSNSTGQHLLYGYSGGGKSVFSLLKPEALFYLSYHGIGYRQASKASGVQGVENWYGNNPLLIASTPYSGYYTTTWFTGVNNLDIPNIFTYASPFLMWESISDFN